jgi:hypothetical protein
LLTRYSRFFGHDGDGRTFDGESILAAYFDAGVFWGNVEHIMSLTVPELLLYLQHADRIRKTIRPGS